MLLSRTETRTRKHRRHGFWPPDAYRRFWICQSRIVCMVSHLLLFYPARYCCYYYSHRNPVLYDRGAFEREPKRCPARGWVLQAEVSVDVHASRSLTPYVKTTSSLSLQPHMSIRIMQSGPLLSLVPGTAWGSRALQFILPTNLARPTCPLKAHSPLRRSGRHEVPAGARSITMRGYRWVTGTNPRVRFIHQLSRWRTWSRVRLAVLFLCYSMR